MRKNPLKVLHTSDWHLGHSLYGVKRDEEFSAFLDWMLKTIVENQVDVLLIAGDIFDNGNPSNRARSLYYTFLSRLFNTSCQQVVVISGNHDSPSFLDAPTDVLKAIHVHTVATPGAVMDGDGAVEHEVLVLRDAAGEPMAIVAAVPFLPDRVLRTLSLGEDAADREGKIRKAIRAHYDAVAKIAAQKQAALGRNVPVVAMGHLFAAGGKATDGIRDLYVGGLGQVDASAFSDVFDYVALGHLHVPQVVGGNPRIRSCGSPLPMGFNEVAQAKQVTLLTFNPNLQDIRALGVPVFQKMVRVTGDLDAVLSKLGELVASEDNIWVEVVYSGERVADLSRVLHRAVENTDVRILRIQNENLKMTSFCMLPEGETLQNLSPESVFERLMDKRGVPLEKRERLMAMYREVLIELQKAPEDRDEA